MKNQFDVKKLAEVIQADTTLCDDLLSQGQALYSPHPSKKGFLIKRSATGIEIGIWVDGNFTPIDNK